MKTERHEKILEIIDSQIILTQDDLQNVLSGLGFNVTQSTVSRDIKELRLIKGHDVDGNYRYISPAGKAFKEQPTSRYAEIITKSVISVDYALNNVIVKCFNGMASSVCVALDTIFQNNMLGSIAGEDTIIIVTRSVEDSQNLFEQINSLM